MKCSNNDCSNKAKFPIIATSDFTGSIFLGKVCEICLPKALKEGYKITDIIIDLDKPLPHFACEHLKE